MATVTGMTAARMLEIEGATVVSAEINGLNHLVFTKHDGTQIDVGEILTAFPISSDIQQGIVELATDVETIAGIEDSLAVTPLGLSALTANDTRKGLVELATDAEVVTGTDTTRAVTPAGLASLAASNTQRGIIETATTTEVATGTDATRAITPFGIAPSLAAKAGSRLHNGTSYAATDGANIYIGSVDPGSVVNGSIWFDTSA